MVGCCRKMDKQRTSTGPQDIIATSLSLSVEEGTRRARSQATKTETTRRRVAFLGEVSSTNSPVRSHPTRNPTRTRRTHTPFLPLNLPTRHLPPNQPPPRISQLASRHRSNTPQSNKPPHRRWLHHDPHPDTHRPAHLHRRHHPGRAPHNPPLAVPHDKPLLQPAAEFLNLRTGVAQALDGEDGVVCLQLIIIISVVITAITIIIIVITGLAR